MKVWSLQESWCRIKITQTKKVCYASTWHNPKTAQHQASRQSLQNLNFFLVTDLAAHAKTRTAKNYDLKLIHNRYSSQNLLSQIKATLLLFVQISKAFKNCSDQK